MTPAQGVYSEKKTWIQDPPAYNTAGELLYDNLHINNNNTYIYTLG